MLGLTPGQEVFAVVKTVSFDRANTTRSHRRVEAMMSADDCAIARK